MKKEYVAPEIEVVEVVVEQGFLYSTGNAFGEEGTVITPEF